MITATCNIILKYLCLLLDQFPPLAGVSLSFSESEYTVSESDSTVLVLLNKNKPLANPLEVVVTALTLEEADLLICLPRNTSLKQAGMCVLTIDCKSRNKFLCYGTFMSLRLLIIFYLLG